MTHQIGAVSLAKPGKPQRQKASDEKCQCGIVKEVYVVHNEVKGNMFELELMWTGECTKGRHELVMK